MGMTSDASCVRVGRKSDANFGRKNLVLIYLLALSDANRGKSNQIFRKGGNVTG